VVKLRALATRGLLIMSFPEIQNRSYCQRTARVTVLAATLRAAAQGRTMGWRNDDDDARAPDV
jgi:hypothetical protein